MKDLQKSYIELSIEQGASEKEVKKARMFYVQVCHPDRYAHNPSLQKDVEEKLKKVNAAYDDIVKDMRQGGGISQTRTANANASSRRERPASQARRSEQGPREEHREEAREHQYTRTSSADRAKADASERKQNRQSAASQAYQGVKRSSTGLLQGIGYLLRTFVLGILLGVPTAQLAAEAYYKGMPSLYRATNIYTSYYGYLKDSIVKKGGVGITYIFSKGNNGKAVKADKRKEGGH